jgi:hypothetical protein
VKACSPSLDEKLPGLTTSALIDAKRTLATIVGLVTGQDPAGEQALGVWIARARASLDAQRSP